MEKYFRSPKLYYQEQGKKEHPKSSKASNKLALTALFLLFILVVFGKTLDFKLQNINQIFSFRFQDTTLSDQIEPLLKDQPGVYAVVIEDLSSDQKVNQFQYNSKEAFPAASLYKLVLMAAIMKEIEQGKIKIDDQISISKGALLKILTKQEFESDSYPETITYTVTVALNAVATVSDNVSAVMLTESLKDKNKLPQMAKELGLDNTEFGGELIMTNAEDIARFFRLLYHGQVVSRKSSDAIIDYLTRSKLNNRIPGLLPQEITVTNKDGKKEPKPLKIAHKTGELSLIRHDAGIVYLEDKPYLIVLMSKDLPFEDDGIELEAKISKAAFDYFSLRNN